ncbi:MAG TPA: hypothetical protein VFG83_08865 [Kofleriaceae bacterium]|nr:hypothetical protein [Kofleriaceae bacterium]
MKALRYVLVTAIAVAACSGDDAEPAKLLASDPAPEILPTGVPPQSFACESVTPKADLARIAGVAEAAISRQPSPFSPPAGVASPCYYAIGAPQANDAGAVSQRLLSFDIDCRPRALSDAAELMATYAAQPEAAAVRIGKSGLDHSRTQILFIDDNAPCYVRVTTPDQPLRTGVARLIAKNLTAATAPMSTRYAAAP